MLERSKLGKGHLTIHVPDRCDAHPFIRNKLGDRRLSVAMERLAVGVLGSVHRFNEHVWLLMANFVTRFKDNGEIFCTTDAVGGIYGLPSGCTYSCDWYL